MKNKQIIIGLIIGALIVFLLSNVVVKKRLGDLGQSLDTRIEKQTEVIKELAIEVGRGGVNEKIEAVVSACSGADSTQYDVLLSSLDKGLTNSDLQTLKMLFDRCGNIPASRRAGMALMLEYEVLLLKQLMTEKSQIEGVELEETNLPRWTELVAKENEVSTLFFELVAVQERIITALILTGSSTGETIEAIKIEAGAINERLNAAAAEATTLRKALISS